jgi:hypothetical protein
MYEDLKTVFAGKTLHDFDDDRNSLLDLYSYTSKLEYTSKQIHKRSKLVRRLLEALLQILAHRHIHTEAFRAQTTGIRAQLERWERLARSHADTWPIELLA